MKLLERALLFGPLLFLSFRGAVAQSIQDSRHGVDNPVPLILEEDAIKLASYENDSTVTSACLFGTIASHEPEGTYLRVDSVSKTSSHDAHDCEGIAWIAFSREKNPEVRDIAAEWGPLLFSILQAKTNLYNVGVVMGNRKYKSETHGEIWIPRMFWTPILTNRGMKKFGPKEDTNQDS